MSDSDSDIRVPLVDKEGYDAREELKLPFEDDLVPEHTRSPTSLRREEKKFEMQDLSVRHQTTLLNTPGFKRSFTIRPNTMAYGSGSSESNRGQTINSKQTVTASMNFPRTAGSGNNMLAGRTLGHIPAHQREEGRNSVDSNYFRKQKQAMIRNMVVYNCLEPFFLSVLMLNAVFYPNLVTALYFTVSLALTSLSLRKEEKKIKLKQVLSIAMIGISIAVLVAKAVFIVDLHNQEDLLLLDPDDVLMYRTSGIYITIETSKMKVVNVFMSIFFDFMNMILSAVLVILYGSQRKDVNMPLRADGIGSYLMNPSLEKHQGKFCVAALIFITIDAVIVQTIFQMIIIILMTIWALDKYERTTFRHLIASYSQAILMIQLVITFVFQVPIIHSEAVIHIIALVLSIETVQLYKVTRASSLRNLPQGLMPADDVHPSRDSDHNIKMRTLQKKKHLADRGRTFGPANSKATFKGTTAGKFKEKTLGLRQKLDESSMHIVATQVYNDFSPQIWLWLCRFSTFIWCHVYHDFQSWIILLWILHSTVFKSTRKFATITNKVYLPIFVAIFLFYYLINIPGVVEFQVLRGDNIAEWRNFGFYDFSVPVLETGLMFLGLIPFFLFMKSSQKFDSFNKDEQKSKFLQKLTDEKAPTVYFFVFYIIKNLDLIVFSAIFFSGVNKIDFYHIFLMFFFVAYVVWPKCFKRNYIVLLYYVDFFVLEKYFYTLIVDYIPSDSLFLDFADVMGLDTEYNDKAKYFRLVPKAQQWILIIVVFIQYQVYRLLHEEKQVKVFSENARANFRARYPRIYHIWELLQHLKKEFLILICFVIFFMMIILSTKSIINWGFQIIICIFMITYVAVGNNAPAHTGIKRLDKVWNFIIYYAGFVLVLQITYQFAALPLVRKSLEIDYFLDMLPLWIRKNLGIIGFQVYSKYIWQKFLVYLLYFSIGVYVRKQLNKWNQENQVGHTRNSDMLEDYFQDKANVDWEKEYLKIRFTTPYLVFKLRKLWVILDKLSQILFVVISIMIMVLSNYWQISLSMAIHLSVFIGLCLVISSRLYQNRKKEKELYKGKGTLTVEEVGEHWTKYKRVVNEHQVKLRQRAWFFQFVVTLFCIALLYPTEFIFYIRKTFADDDNMNIVHILDYLIFYLFWGGIYHSPEVVSKHGYFYNIWGYLIILILLIFEKNAQQWALNRFGCSNEKVSRFTEIEKNLIKPKEKRVTIAEQAILEEEEEQSNESFGRRRLSENKLKIIDEASQQEYSKSSSERSSRGSDSIQREKSQVTDNDPDKDLSLAYLKEEIRRWLRKRYKIKILNGVKILLEDFIQLLLLISSVYKDSVIGLILLLGVFIYMTRRKIRTMVRIAWITGFCMILQYGLALSNLSTMNNPMDFPYPFNPYPSKDDPEGQFFIPWYLKIPLLRDSLKWSLYLGMGISNTKLNGLWIDYAIMGVIQAHLFYFGCQLFSVDYKVVKGDYLNDIFDEYCKKLHGESSNETIKKETRKLKHSLFFYNFYKGIQLSVFMHFHQVTIVVTLLLAILARSLFSFGYIIVCMIMIYENHKFFRKEQQNFRLQRVLKYWLRPYVFIDITLQLIFQIPLEFIHYGQDVRWSWQNIIGFQEIWVLDEQNDEAFTRSIIFIILKTFTYFFVTLQIQIFSSTAYKKYIKKDLVKFIDMAETKGMSIRMKFNNEKINKIKKQTVEKKKMDDMLKKLKKLIKKWQTQFYDQDHDHQEQTPMGNSAPSGLTKALTSNHMEQHQVKKTPTAVKEDKQYDEDKKDDGQVKNQKTMKQGKAIMKKQTTNSNFQSNTYSDSRSSRLPLIIEEEELNAKDDIEILEKLKSKLSIFAKFLIWLKKKHTEQIVFINSESFLMRVAQDMMACKTNIYTKLERKMLKDIREIKRKRLNQSSNLDEDSSVGEIQIKDLQLSKEYLRFGGLFKGYLAVILEIMVSYSDSITYLLMIVSMMRNAGLISIVYPMIVFGYALMEEVNPKKKFWYNILIYTEFLIMIKFLCQLQFWEAFLWDYQIQEIQDILSAWHIGLERQASGAFGDMLAYFLPEILILFAIMSHIQKELISGFLFLKETEMEGIEEALFRYLKTTKDQKLRSSQRKGSPARDGLMASVGIEDDEDVNPMTVHLRRDVKRYYREWPLNCSFNIHEDALDHLALSGDEEQDFAILDDNRKSKKAQLQKRNSMVDEKELRKIFNEICEQDLLREEIKTGFVMKTKSNMQRLLYKNQFFARLFPSVKEQKPGKDLYAFIATFQFCICLFLIFFYTKMDADVTNISDVMTYNQFSGQMVIALFLQIAIMILDRYLYKSKTFISVQEKERKKKGVKQEQSTVVEPENKHQSIVERQKSGGGKSFVQFLKKDTNVKNLMGKAKEKQIEAVDSSEEEEERRNLERQVVLEQTKITFAIVSKFYLQWMLLISVHLLVFWYYPIAGNMKLQNHAYCDNKSIVGCNEFGGNWALVIFYLLYCAYFWTSALQIRYGVPEMKKGNFMMNDYGRPSQLAVKGFMAIPFLFELKTFADWTFTSTALDVFQWFILSATHSELFLAKCLQDRYQRKPLGKPIPLILKMALGVMGQIGIILLIAGPLLLFSSFNPISEKNPVINASVRMNILVQQENSIAVNTVNLFTNNYVTELMEVSKQQYQVMRFGQDLRTKSYDLELVQYVKMNNFSDSNWGVSLPNRQSLQEEFREAAGSIGNTSIKLQFAYQFERSNQNAPTSSHSFELDLRKPDLFNVVRAFNRTLSLDCSLDSNLNNSFIVPPFFSPVHLLSDKEDAVPQLFANWTKGLRIFYSCRDYWVVDQMVNSTCFEKQLPQSNLTGVSFFTFSNRISPSYFKFSILTFYISIVLVIGKLIRGIMVIGGNRIFIYEIPNSEQLLMLCECIYIYRLRSELEQEEELYFTFVDIMRSPEMIKAITGSAIKKKIQ